MFLYDQKLYYELCWYDIIMAIPRLTKCSYTYNIIQLTPWAYLRCSYIPYSGLLLRGPKFCESVKIAPVEIFAIAKFASQSGVGSREL